MANIKSALISALLMGILAMAVYTLGVGDIWKIDTRALINVGIMSLLTGVVSMLKSMMTTSEGNFVGVIKIK